MTFGGYTEVFGGGTLQPSQSRYLEISISSSIALEWATDTPNTPYPFASIIRVSATVGGLSIALPDGALGSEGASTLIRNYGANAINITDSSASQILVIQAGQSAYIYLTDSAASPGSWDSTVFGVGSASLSAGSVASSTVVARNNTLNSAFPSTSVNGNYTIATTERGTLFVVGVSTSTLTTPAAATAGNNFFFMVHNASDGTITIDPHGAETLDGNASLSLAPGESTIVVTNGTAWYTVGYGRSNLFSFSRLSKNVGGSSNVTLTTAESANVIQVFTGTLTGSIDVIEQGGINVYYVTNSTSGAYTLRVKTALGTGVVVDQGTSTILFCDGVNVYSAVTTTAGTVTQVNTSGDMTGGPITTTGTLSLSPTGVTPGIYASGLDVSATGRVNAVDEASAHLFPTWSC